VLEGSRGELLATSQGTVVVRCLHFLFCSWPFRCHPERAQLFARVNRTTLSSLSLSLSLARSLARSLSVTPSDSTKLLRGVGGEERKRTVDKERTSKRERKRKREGDDENFLSVGTLACHHPRSVINTVAVRHHQWVESWIRSLVSGTRERDQAPEPRLDAAGS